MRPSPVRTFRRNFDPKLHGHPVPRGSDESQLFMPEYRKFIYFRTPSWEKANCYRFLPTPVPTDISPDGWSPWRRNSEPGNWGDWMRIVPMCVRVGSPPITFIAYDQIENPDISKVPYTLIHDLCDQVCRSPESAPKHWLPLLGGKKGKGALLPGISTMMLVQAAIVQQGDKVYPSPIGLDPKKSGYVVGFKNTAVGAIETAMEALVPGYNGDVMDYQKAYAFGDPISIYDGAFFQIFEKGHDPASRMGAAVPSRGSLGQAAQQAMSQPTRPGYDGDDEKRTERTAWDCSIVKTFAGFDPYLDTIEPALREITRAWDEILWYPTTEEQIKLLERSLPADLVVMALEDFYKELISESTYNRAVNRAQAPSGYSAPPANQGGASPHRPMATGQPMLGRPRPGVVDSSVADEQLPPPEPQVYYDEHGNMVDANGYPLNYAPEDPSQYVDEQPQTYTPPAPPQQPYQAPYAPPQQNYQQPPQQNYQQPLQQRRPMAGPGAAVPAQPTQQPPQPPYQPPQAQQQPSAIDEQAAAANAAVERARQVAAARKRQAGQAPQQPHQPPQQQAPPPQGGAAPRPMPTRPPTRQQPPQQ